MENIQSKQLRIGNLVKEGEVRIIRDDLIFVKGNSFSLDKFEPIPLTEEWLLKFGFTKKENKQYWYKDDSMLRFALLDGCLHCSIGDDKNGVLYNRLYSVHQLQNLFYAVNNTELTIK
jgi:hypothetical protein